MNLKYLHNSEQISIQMKKKKKEKLVFSFLTLHKSERWTRVYNLT